MKSLRDHSFFPVGILLFGTRFSQCVKKYLGSLLAFGKSTQVLFNLCFFVAFRISSRTVISEAYLGSYQTWRWRFFMKIVIDLLIKTSILCFRYRQLSLLGYIFSVNIHFLIKITSFFKLEKKDQSHAEVIWLLAYTLLAPSRS